MRKKSHYDYLTEHLPAIFEAVGVRGGWEANRGIIVAHGDKGFQYKVMWAEAGIPYPHGMAVYLLTYCQPFEPEVRQTEKGWVAPVQWVIDNYERFREHLPDCEGF